MPTTVGRWGPSHKGSRAFYHSLMNDEGVSAGRVLAPGLVQLAALGVHGSITGAAGASGVSQPTLSRALRRWQQEIGVELAAPHGHGVRLTDAGVHLSLAASAALELMDDAVAQLRAGAGPSRLAVGHLHSLGPAVVSELVASYLPEHPDVLVSHSEDTTEGLLGGLDAGRIGVAITSPRPPERYEWLMLGEQSLVVLLPRTHRLATAPRIDLRDLAGERFVALDPRHHARRAADRLCARVGIRPRIVLEADDFVTIDNYVGSGIGVAVLPYEPSLGARTAVLPIDDDTARREFGLVWPSEPGEPVDGFVAHARAVQAQYPDWANLTVAG